MVREMPQLRSAVYHGEVRHDRLGAPEHRFRYPIAMPLLFLDEIEQICASYRGWSSDRRNLVEYREADFLPGANRDGVRPDLAISVRNTVQDQVGVRPEGPIAMLANLRGWGWSSTRSRCISVSIRRGLRSNTSLLK